MTVIKGNKNYNYPKPGSTVASDTESLHLGSATASDSESVNDELHTNVNYRTVARPLAYKPVCLTEEVINVKKCSGRKKLRRYFNRCVLQTLDEEEDDGLVIFMESYKSPFTRLLEDDCALDYWNKFIEKSDEEQAKIVEAFTNRCNKNSHIECSQKQVKIGRVSSKLKHTLKIKKNLSLEAVKCSEDRLLDFFKLSPEKIFVECPATSFGRLLLHAIAQYHGLKSTSVLNNENKRYVEIQTLKDNWNPADCFLTDFIGQLRT